MFQSRFHSLLRLTPFTIGFAAVSASAATYTLDFNTALTGDAGHDWSAFTVASLSMEDSGLDQVKFTLTHFSNSLAGTQKIKDLWLSINPYVSVTQSGQTPAITFNSGLVYDANGHAGVGGDYNKKFNLAQAFKTGQNSFNEGMSVSFYLAGVGLSTTSFLAPVQGTLGPMNAAIHYQGLEGLTADSVKLGGIFIEGGSGQNNPVPEPASLAMISFAGLAAFTGRKKTQKPGSTPNPA